MNSNDNAKLGMKIAAVRSMVSRGMCGLEMALVGYENYNNKYRMKSISKEGISGSFGGWGCETIKEINAG